MNCRTVIGWTAAAAVFGLMSAASAEEPPIKIGMSMPQTGGLAGGGKPSLLGIEIWRDDVNAKGGLLGRKVELVVYDDKSSASETPALYAKLIDVDKVDLLFAPYATVPTAPILPLVVHPAEIATLQRGLALAELGRDHRERSAVAQLLYHRVGEPLRLGSLGRVLHRHEDLAHPVLGLADLRFQHAFLVRDVGVGNFAGGRQPCRSTRLQPIWTRIWSIKVRIRHAILGQFAAQSARRHAVACSTSLMAAAISASLTAILRRWISCSRSRSSISCW